MKKIIYIANVRLPTEKAHGIQIMKMCQAFANAEHDLTLVVPRRKNQIKESVWQYYAQKPNFKIEYLKITDFMKIVIPRISFYLQGRSFLKSALRYLKNKEADIIYSRDLFFAKRLSYFNKNVFYEMHRLPRSFNKNDLKKVKGIIAITKGLKNALIEKGISKDKIIVAPDGVDLEEFNINVSKKEAREKLSLPLDKKIVVYAGLFDKWKGYLTLLEASKFFDREVKLVMIGGTKEQVKKLKEEYPTVIFLGYLPYTDLPINQKAADVLVLPNSGKEGISKYWTSPLKLFSYMTSQRPIIASDLPSLREVLNENNAVLVIPDNSKRLAKGIKETLKNTDFSVKISRQAYKDVQQYSWQKRANNILKFISGK